MTEEETKIINRTSSEIRTMISENNIHGLSEESLVNYISILLRDAGVDSKLVVEILNKVNPDS